jgi:hypothetical protein
VCLHELGLCALERMALNTTCFLHSVSLSSIRPFLVFQRRSYLCCVVELEAGRALDIEVSAVSQRVVRAHNDLDIPISS